MFTLENLCVLRFDAANNDCCAASRRNNHYWKGQICVHINFQGWTFMSEDGGWSKFAFFLYGDFVQRLGSQNEPPSCPSRTRGPDRPKIQPQHSNNRNTVILINSNSKIHVIFTSTAELLLFRITVMEKTQMDHTVSKTIYIIELAAAKPPPTLRYASFLILYGPVVSSP